MPKAKQACRCCPASVEADIGTNCLLDNLLGSTVNIGLCVSNLYHHLARFCLDGLIHSSINIPGHKSVVIALASYAAAWFARQCKTHWLLTRHAGTGTWMKAPFMRNFKLILIFIPANYTETNEGLLWNELIQSCTESVVSYMHGCIANAHDVRR